MELTDKNVQDTLLACLYDDRPEDTSKAVMVTGLVRQFGFDPDRLKAREADILSLLSQLPRDFMADGGGGHSFLAACNRADGTQWTGEHRAMEELFCLGEAIGKAKPALPRDLWAALPGGMPYYVVTL